MTTTTHKNLNLFCHHCGASIPSNARFCTQCGTQVPAKPSTVAPSSPRATPPPLKPALVPQKAEGRVSKALKAFAGFIFIAVLLFSIVGAILKIVSQVGSAVSGDFGPEHVYLVATIVIAIGWFVKRARK